MKPASAQPARAPGYATLLYTLVLLCCAMGSLLGFLTEFSFPGVGAAAAGCLVAAGVACLAACARKRHRLWVLVGALGAAVLAALAMYSHLVQGAVFAAQLLRDRFVFMFPEYGPYRFTSTPEGEQACAVLLFFAGLVITALLAVAILWRHSFLLTLPLTLPLLWGMFAFAGLPPVLPTVLLFGSWCALLFRGFAVARQPGASSLLSLGALALACLYMGSLFVIFPSDTYSEDAEDNVVRLEDALQRVLPGAADWLPEVNLPVLAEGHRVGGRASASVDMTQLGSLAFNDGVALRVQGDLSGVQYLRGFACGVYEDSRWGNLQGRDYPSRSLDFQPLTVLANNRAPQYIGSPAFSLSIELADEAGPFCYTPYQLTGISAAEPLYVQDAYAYLRGTANSYNAGYLPAALPGGELLEGEQLYLDFITEAYTQLPGGSLRRTLTELAEQAGISPASTPQDWEATATQVARYIRNAATYTRSPETTPRGTDPVIYFLRTGKEGYCVHFASAAALMLRALGVPARYAEGFVLSGSYNAGGWLDVPAENAHAWVEVWLPTVGWQPLEVTPGGADVLRGGASLQVPPASSSSSQPAAASSSAVSSRSSSSSAGGGTGQVGSASGQNESAPPAAGLPAWLGHALWVLVAAGLLAAAVFFTRRGIYRRRQKRFGQPLSNRAALEMYRYLCKLSAFGYTPSSEAAALADKAMFSQHVLAAEERQLLLTETQQAREGLINSLPPLKRAWLHLRCL